MSRAVLAGLLMCVLALVGCSAFTQMVELSADLEAAGYGTPAIDHNTTNGDGAVVIQVMMPNDIPTDEDANEIAEIVWTKYPMAFDQLVISINGEVFVDASPAELTDQFGPRPAPERAADSGTNVTAIVVVLVVAALFAGLMVILWRRGRRPPPPLAPPAHPQLPNPYQHPPQGGPQGPNYI